MSLIVTCARHFEQSAKEEVERILSGLGDPAARASDTGISGILTVATGLEPVGAVAGIREMFLDEPWSIRYCMRIMPVQRMTGTSIGEIEEAARSLLGAIPEGASYRVSVEKRNSGISRQEIITKVASLVKNPVSLDAPDWTVLIEILGGRTGVSVLAGGGIFSAERIRRGLGDDGGLLD